ncbi:Large ribosomal subunit protein bL19c-like protein [Drosera capensis]
MQSMITAVRSLNTRRIPSISNLPRLNPSSVDSPIKSPNGHQFHSMGNPASITFFIHRRMDCYSWCGGLGGCNDETASLLGGIGDAGGCVRGGRRASVGVFSCRGLATGAGDDGGESVKEDGAGNASNVAPRIKFKRLDKTARHIMQILNKEAVEEVKAQREVPDIRPGYIVQLKVEVPENKRRITTIKGIVIARRNSGISTTFRIRRLVAGVGVESLFPLYSPNIKVIKVLDKKKVRRAKLYYLRDKMNGLKK